MITRNIVEKLFKELEELDNKYNNISNTNIFELAIYLYIRYGEVPVELYDKLEVTMPGEESKTASFIDILNAGNGVVKTSNGGNVKFWNGTQAEYDAIATKDANTLYIIK